MEEIKKMARQFREAIDVARYAINLGDYIHL